MSSFPDLATRVGTQSVEVPVLSRHFLHIWSGGSDRIEASKHRATIRKAVRCGGALPEEPHRCDGFFCSGAWAVPICVNMMIVDLDDVWEQISVELDLAHQARSEGNEGRARVCARRAAGWAVAAYRQRQTGVRTHANAYAQLLWIRDHDAFPMSLREAAARLTVRVGKDTRLPHPEDPLQDAEMIVRRLSEEFQ